MKDFCLKVGVCEGMTSLIVITNWLSKGAIFVPLLDTKIETVV